MRRNIWKYLAGLLLFCNLFACSTTVSLTTDHKKYQSSYVYSGTKLNLDILANPGTWAYSVANTPLIYFSPFLYLGCIVDPPLSFVADTVLLPFTTTLESD